MGLFRKDLSHEAKIEQEKAKAAALAERTEARVAAMGAKGGSKYLPQRPGSYGGDVEVIFEQVAQKKEKSEGVWLDAPFPSLFRAKVPSGWIIRARNAMTFVPDPDHSWR